MADSLADLHLRTSYHKGRNDIAAEFYLPCMSLATEYDRAVGYFRSTVFLIAWPSLRGFARRGGRMRILCSHVLADEDVAALTEGYQARLDERLTAELTRDIRSMMDAPQLQVPARVLAALVCEGVVDLKVVLLPPREATSNRIFHDKLGLFRDRRGNTAMFKGSMNETWSGLAADGNLESVDVAASWLGGRDLERTTVETSYFNELWGNRFPGAIVRDFPAVAREELRKIADPDWESTIERAIQPNPVAKQNDHRGRTLLPHQEKGLAAWRANGRRGILEFATGSGKTFTALVAIRELLGSGEPVLVLVPDQVLFRQWHDELTLSLADLKVNILKAGAGHSSWRDALAEWTSRGSEPRLVLATVQTARGEEFRTRLRGGAHLALIADEVHRLGSLHNRALLDESSFGARLGLSATPERFGDSIGTSALLSFFRGILEPRYGLADAVGDGVLSRYFYRPHAVELEPAEFLEWQHATAEISKVYARMKRQADGDSLGERLRLLILRRAGIAKHAARKVQLAVDVVREHFRRGQRWIIYCEDLRQLELVSDALQSAGFPNIPFHSQMEGDREETLRWLAIRGGIVVAIRCLDEGVDVPSVTHALILASSKNPREYIQRRGRVLRAHRDKSLAYIHDAIVLAPRASRVSDGPPDPVTIGELARALQFAQHADNPSAAADLQKIAVESGMDWRQFLTDGVEDAEE